MLISFKRRIYKKWVATIMLNRPVHCAVNDRVPIYPSKWIFFTSNYWTLIHTNMYSMQHSSSTILDQSSIISYHSKSNSIFSHISLCLFCPPPSIWTHQRNNSIHQMCISWLHCLSKRVPCYFHKSNEFGFSECCFLQEAVFFFQN